MTQPEETATKEECPPEPAHCPPRSNLGCWLRRFLYVFILLPLLIFTVISAWVTIAPPNFDRFIPQLSSYLSQQSGFHIDLQRLSIRGGMFLAIEGSGISISHNKTTEPFIKAETLLVRFSGFKWAMGLNSINLIIEKADIKLHRRDNGNISIGNKNFYSQNPNSSSSKPPMTPLPFSSVTLSDSKVLWLDEQVEDKNQPAKIDFSSVNASVLFRPQGVLKISLSAKVPTKRWTTTLKLDGKKDSTGDWIGELSVGELHGSTFKSYLTNIQVFKGFSSPIDLTASLDWDQRLKVFTSYWRLHAGWGVIKWPEMFRWPLPITGLIADGSIKVENGITRLDVEQFDLDNLHGKAHGRFLLTGLGGDQPAIDLVADAGGVPVDKAKFYYPYGIMHDSVVNWLDTSLKNGIINHASVEIKGPLKNIPFEINKDLEPDLKTKLERETKFHIAADTSDMSLRFFPGILPLRNITGSVVFDRKSFVGKVKKANFGNSKRVYGEARIEDLTHKPTVEVAFGAKKADLKSLWKEIMASQTLQWDRAIGMAGSRISGRSDVNMKVTIPLWNLKNTTFSGRMGLSNADVTLPFLDEPFSNIKGWLSIEPKKIGVSVIKSSFDKFPVHGQINLLDYTNPKTVKFDARFNSAITDKRLGKWFSPLLGAYGEFFGTAPFWLDIKRPAQAKKFKVKAKLVADPLNISGTMGWQKPQGEKGDISFSGALDIDGKLVISNIGASLGNLGFDGDGRWDVSSNQGELHLSKFRLGETQGRVGIAQTNPVASGLGDWLVRADLDLLDLSPFWETKIGQEVEQIKPIVDREWPRVNIKLKSQRLLMAEQYEATFIVADIDVEKRFFKLHTLQGLWGDGEAIMNGEVLWPYQFGSGFYTGWFNMESDDVGSLLESLNVNDGFMYGGSGSLDITLDGFIPPGGEFKDYLTGVGQIKLRSGSFAKLEFISTILGLFSLKDLPQLVVGDRPDLDTQGFRYNSFQGELIFEDSILRANAMELDGPAMKVVLSGMVDLPEDRIKLLVGIRPLQNLDEIVSKIPVLGTLLTGSRGAMLESQFLVNGKLSKPEVEIRPLSTLTPGIIRDIINTPAGTSKDTLVTP
ncbi:MAG: AsmA-like C-terminal domain-containing protein [Magnetococcales bacterium]|nr:AsmA-like C-terminal domain-containing protein [Magnetococcales bacterium]